jgi:hypothetical protein
VDLPSVTNAPRELSLAGALFRARTLTLADLGEVLAWLEDHLPPDPERDGPPLFSSEASRVALASTEGLAVVLHLSLLSCHPDLTRDEARALAAGMTPEDEARLMSIAFRRRPSYAKPGEGPPAKDLAEVQWGLVVEALTQHRGWLYPEVARLTLDQYDNHAAKGELAGPDTLDPRDVQRMWEEAVAKDEPIPEVLP